MVSFLITINGYSKRRILNTLADDFLRESKNNRISLEFPLESY